jgi:hypothetical protein
MGQRLITPDSITPGLASTLPNMNAPSSVPVTQILAAGACGASALTHLGVSERQAVRVDHDTPGDVPGMGFGVVTPMTEV